MQKFRKLDVPVPIFVEKHKHPVDVLILFETQRPLEIVAVHCELAFCLSCQIFEVVVQQVHLLGRELDAHGLEALDILLWKRARLIAHRATGEWGAGVRGRLGNAKEAEEGGGPGCCGAGLRSQDINPHTRLQDPRPLA